MPSLRGLALDHQVLALPAGRTTVRFLPPLSITEEHVDRAVGALEAVL
jgi:acetylornithine/LysW-gamma-L-lysine aminotransferase